VDLARNLIQRINVGDSLARSAAARPGQLAVVDSGRRWTYAEFNGWVNQVAHGLAARGYTRGDALGLASGNSAEFLAVYYACAKLGVACVPVNLGWRAAEAAYVLDHSGARGLAVEAQLTGQVRDAVVCTPAILVGAAIHVMRGFDPAALLNLIEAERITQIFGLPVMYRAVLDHPSFADRDLASLRRAVYAMAPMPDQLIRRCIDGFGCDFALLFGQTEMSPVTTLFRPEHQLSHIGAVGTPITGVQVAIMGPDGEILPPGQQGEIVYRGPSTMAGYLHNEAATEAAFAHGWFHSGDVGAFGDDGVLWFADRYKDVIKTGGENVASIEVEKAVYAAEPRVAEAVVVGLPHERWSEAITAVVVPRPGETLDEAVLLRALRERLDGYKVPKAVIVVDELPKTSTGKIRKNVVRDTHASFYQG